MARGLVPDMASLAAASDLWPCNDLVEVEGCTCLVELERFVLKAWVAAELPQPSWGLRWAGALFVVLAEPRARSAALCPAELDVGSQAGAIL